jgi:hypothetical protein
MAAWTWELWWKSPMAHMWTEADWPALLRMILILDGHVSIEKLREVRIQEDRLGLSPKGRQGLRWRLAPGVVVDPPPPTPKAKSPASTRSLHLVEGDAVHPD